MRCALLLLVLVGCTPSATSPNRDPSTLPTVMPNPTTVPKPEAGFVFVSDNSFDRRVLTVNGPTLVDFYADWCGPCRSMEPVLERIAKDYRVAKVNADHCPELMKRYQVHSLPTLAVFRGGKEVWRQAGTAPEVMLRDALKNKR